MSRGGVRDTIAIQQRCGTTLGIPRARGKIWESGALYMVDMNREKEDMRLV